MRATISDARISWDGDQLGGSITHNGWTLRVPPGAHFEWPVRPYNPYRNGPETRLNRAIGTLTVPLTFTPDPASYVRPTETVFNFTLSVGAP